MYYMRLGLKRKSWSMVKSLDFMYETLARSMCRCSTTHGRFDEVPEGITLRRYGWILEDNIGIWTMDIDGS